MSTIAVKIKEAAGVAVDIIIDSTDSVEDLKREIEALFLVPVEQQKLVFRGQVLSDDQTLEHYEIGNGNLIHLVRIRPPHLWPRDPEADAPPTFLTPQAPTAAYPFGPPLPRGGAGAAGGNQLMASLFNLPGMASLLSNPDVMRELMMANPSTRQVMERNPEIAHALQDPRTLRQTMEMMRNPSLMQEMMRNTDRALSNLDTMPGGMDALARLYNEVQRPLEEAREESLSSSSPSSSSATGASPEPQPRVPLGPFDPQPLPNPWRQRQPAGGPFGRAGMANPFLGGMGLDSMADMYQSPVVRQMAMQFLQQPDAMRGLGGAPALPAQPPGSGGPAGAAGGGAPFLLDFMRRSFANTAPPSPPRPGSLPLSSAGSSTTAANAPPAEGAGSTDLHAAPPGPATPSILPAPVAAGVPPNPILGMFNPLLATLGPPAAAPVPLSSPPPPPQQVFAEQLQQLRDMGFEDEPAMLQALQANGGNLTLALEQLLGTRL